MDIGTVVASGRIWAGLTQQQLAARAGTSQPAVALLERGQGNPGIDTVRRLVASAGYDLRIDLVPQGTPRDAVVEAYKADVDRTLLRDNLRKSVDRRLRDAEAFRKAADELQASVRRSRRAR
jgi:transcriptional regulator with XRE-family HTH domain